MIVFGAAFLVAAATVPLSTRWLRGSAWIDSPRADRHHTRTVPRTGGVAWMAGVLAGILLGVPLAVAALLVAALLAALALGRLDEAGRLGPLRKALLQGLLLIAAWIALRLATGAGLPEISDAPRILPGLAIALVLQTALGIFDNLDGALGIAAAAGLAALAFAADAPWSARAAAAGAGATIGFLLWNRPPARVFLGNTGSQPVALLVSLLLLLALSPSTRDVGETNGAEWALLLPLAWPLADLVFVSATRMARGIAPWRGGRDHTTHRLARAAGSDAAAAAAILVVSLAGLAGALRLLWSAN